MRRKILAITLCMMMFITGFACVGCGKTVEEKAIDNFAGTWAATSDTWGDFSIVLNEDGTAEVTMLDIETTGTWVANEDGTITVTTEDFEDFDVTAADGQITYEFAGDDIVFDKVEAAEQEGSEEGSDAVVEDASDADADEAAEDAE